MRLYCRWLYVTYPLFLSDFNETRKFSKDLRKYVKFHENPSSRSRVILCEQVDATNVTVGFPGGKSDLLLLLLPTIDRLSLPLLCTFVARRDGRTVRPTDRVRPFTQSCVVMCERSVDMVSVVYCPNGVVSCFSFHSFKCMQHNNLFPLQMREICRNIWSVEK
jgi:hypothetical protein